MIAQVTALLTAYGFTDILVTANRLVSAINLNQTRLLTINVDCKDQIVKVEVSDAKTSFFRNPIITDQGFDNVACLQKLLDTNRAFTYYLQGCE